MAQGGKILAETVEHLRGAVRAGLSTGDLDQIAEDYRARLRHLLNRFHHGKRQQFANQ